MKVNQISLRCIIVMKVPDQDQDTRKAEKINLHITFRINGMIKKT